jgi:hypothetical protein
MRRPRPSEGTRGEWPVHGPCGRSSAARTAQQRRGQSETGAGTSATRPGGASGQGAAGSRASFRGMPHQLQMLQSAPARRAAGRARPPRGASTRPLHPARVAGRDAGSGSSAALPVPGHQGQCAGRNKQPLALPTRDGPAASGPNAYAIAPEDRRYAERMYFPARTRGSSMALACQARRSIGPDVLHGQDSQQIMARRAHGSHPAHAAPAG